jgi:GPH family glycoside/pentoside/hexuronide:cation symporter
MNLLLRTLFTIFVVPYTALSFEMCSDYDDRSKIQGVRTAMNMAANLLGPAMAHKLFFGDDSGAVRANNIPQNYVDMGMVFTVTSTVFVVLMLLFTRKYVRDSRGDMMCGSGIRAFFRDSKDIVLDRYPRWVFLFVFFVLLGIVLVSMMQMYVFEDFMRFTGGQKSFAHGATMVGMGLGSLFGAVLVRRFDKKIAICIGVVWSVVCDGILAMCFLTGWMAPDQAVGGFPLAFVVFSFFHGAYWFGNGIMMPVSVSMMADVAEIHQISTGINKDGSYAAMYSLATKISVSIGMLVSGYCLKWIGFVSGADAVQAPDVIWRICAMTLVFGPAASLASMFLILRYPVTKSFLENLRQAAADVP